MAHENDPIASDAIEYQPDAIAIEMQPIPGGARWTLRLLALLLIFGIGWASIATVDKVVTAQGKLISTGKTIVVQPLSEGVITRLHVEEGQEVQEGQVLVTLDPTFADADVEGLRERLESLEQEARRLETEMGDGGSVIDPDRNELQERILTARNREYEQRLKTYEQKIKELIAKAETKKDQHAQGRKQLRLARDMEKMFQDAMAKGVATRLELIKAQSQRMKQEEAVERITNELQEMRQEAERLIAERDAFVNNWTSTSTQELVKTNREIESIRSQLEKAEHISDFVELRAPRRAVVLQLATRSEGPWSARPSQLSPLSLWTTRWRPRSTSRPATSALCGRATTPASNWRHSPSRNMAHWKARSRLSVRTLSKKTRPWGPQSPTAHVSD